MINLIKKYWDIFSGAFAGLLLSLVAEFKLESIQLCYSIIILILVSIGILRIIKQSIENQRHKKERKRNVVDRIVDTQKSIKAISLAQSPTKEGERIGELIIKTWEVTKRTMSKIKEFLSKFKGFMLTAALAVLTIVEMCGGFINELCGGALTVNGVEILPMITLGATAIVGIVSNGYSKEQREKIKALFSKSTTNEIVHEQIKKSIKENSTQLSQYSKMLNSKQTEFENLQSELVSAKNTHSAKQEMYNMIPQLATADDVRLALSAVTEIEAKIESTQKEIDEIQATIKNLGTTITALKSQL